MEKKVYDLIVDPEFRETARALLCNEKDLLSDDIIARGCLTPLIVWNGTVIDGHNRYEICHKFNIPFAIEEVEFENRTDAKLWIITNQLSRRNLSQFEKCELIIPMENELKRIAEERRKESISRYRQMGEKLPPSPKTRDILSELVGVSPRMIDKVRVIVREADEPTKEGLRTGKKKISAVYADLTKKPGEEKPAKKSHHEDAYDKVAHMDEPIEVPCERGEEEQTPRPYEFVKNQVWYAMENMLKELSLGLSWLREDDRTNIPELKEMVKGGSKRAIELFDKLEG